MISCGFVAGFHIATRYWPIAFRTELRDVTYGTEALLSLVPKLFQKLRETIQHTGAQEEGHKEGGSKKGREQGNTKEEELVLLLSILERCSRLDALPALTSDGVAQLQAQLAHGSAHVRRAAAAAMMALSVPLEGKQQLCAQGVLSDVLTLLQDPDTEVRANSAGVFMNVLVITQVTDKMANCYISQILTPLDQSPREQDGRHLNSMALLLHDCVAALTNQSKLQCLDLGLIPVLLDIVSSEELSVTYLDQEHTPSAKVLVLYCLRSLTLLSEAPAARRLLMEERPRLEKWRNTDPELSRAAETALRVISWTP